MTKGKASASKANKNVRIQGRGAGEAAAVDEGGVMAAGMVAPATHMNSNYVPIDSLLPERYRRPKECPAGLEGLCFIDTINVVQQIQAREEMGGAEQANKYDICTSWGAKLMTAHEESDLCTRKCCGQRRGWTFHMHDHAGNDLFNFRRGIRFDSCCCPCALHKCVVETGGQTVASISQRWSTIRPIFSIMNPEGKVDLIISGPFCTMACMGSNVLYEVLSKDKKHLVGSIEKVWAGVIQEQYTKADRFVVTFPKDLHVRCKLALIAATILIDFMYYEKEPPKSNENKKNKGAALAKTGQY